MAEKLVMWLNEVGMEDIELVGGKNASLGEMIKGLSSIGVKIPMGFVVTSKAYHYFIDYNNLRDKIREALAGLDPNNIEDLSRRGLTVRELIKGGQFPEDLKNEIIKDLFTEFGESYYKREDLKVEGDKGIKLVEDLKNKEIKEFAGLKVKEKDLTDGVKLIFEDDSWILFRASGTEPVLRIYVETPKLELTEKVLNEGKQLIL